MANTNLALAQTLAHFLKAQGVRCVVLCPGARNVDLVRCLAEDSHFQCHYHPEERSGAFFALGLARKLDAPVAVVTTSGTAAAELLPATIEAHYQSVPLILVTADRPRAARGTGAPQAIEQVDLFLHYTEHCLDWATEDPRLELGLGSQSEDGWHGPTQTQTTTKKTISHTEGIKENLGFFWSKRRPLHVNICLQEPESLTSPRVEATRQVSLNDSPSLDEARGRSSQKVNFGPRPFLIVSTLSAKERQKILPALRQWRGLIYLEATSGLRADPELSTRALRGNLQELVTSFKQNEVTSVIRIGGVPLHRLWRDLESHLSIKVFVYNDSPFSGLSRGVQKHGSIAELPQDLEGNLNSGDDSWVEHHLAAAQVASANLQQSLQMLPLSEPGLLACIAAQLPQSSRIYLGNSLPIREWDLVNHTHADIWANRGANGIDGQLSSALGLASEDHPLVVILGDLTALYDLAGPWMINNLKQPLLLVIVNNGGGRIFSRLFNDERLEHRHALNFQGWAQMWNLPYHAWLSAKNSQSTLASDAFSVCGWPEKCSNLLLEIHPDAQQTHLFWESLSQAAPKTSVSGNFGEALGNI